MSSVCRAPICVIVSRVSGCVVVCRDVLCSVTVYCVVSGRDVLCRVAMCSVCGGPASRGKSSARFFRRNKEGRSSVKADVFH